MTTVYYTTSFVPPELITACGCRPQRLTGTFQNNRFFRMEGMCAFTQAWLQTLLNKAKNETFITVFATSCDQMRRACDLYAHHCSLPVFLLNVPSTDTPNALAYYRRQLQRLQQFLCSQSGKPFNRGRLQRETSASGSRTLLKSDKPCKIALIGEAVPACIQMTLTEVLKTSNAGIAVDATGNKFMNHFSGFRSATVPNEPLAALAEDYFQLPAVWKRPNERYCRWLMDTVHTNAINGVILFRYVFCDLWHSAACELKKRLPVPLLEIDLDGSAELSVSAVSRIQAFTEMLAP